MSGLQERLDRIKTSFLKQAPADAVAVMDRATDELRQSGIMSRVPPPGSQLPAFNLENTEGNLVGSSQFLDKGSLVITFYRGVW